MYTVARKGFNDVLLVFSEAELGLLQHPKWSAL